MKERPILFSGPMVRAILDGRKTQTRRIMKPQPLWMGAPGVPFKTLDADPAGVIRCPFGKPGDQLRISEEVKVKPLCEDWFTVKFAADNLYLERMCDVGMMQRIKNYKTGVLRGVHLPPAFSRPTRLEIAAVRADRLNDISEADAVAEGCQCAGVPPSISNRGAFAKLWQSINGPDSWAANPWVWVIEFRSVGE